jgi:TniQ
MHEIYVPKSIRSPKLAPQILMPDESISSVVDRQANLWGVSRSELMREIAPGSIGMVAMGDLDVRCRWMFLDIYADKTGISRVLLEEHCGDRWEPLLNLKDRHAYCPMCFFDDATNGHTPYFRLDWSRIFLTHCRVHQCPLYRWPRLFKDGTRKLPHEWFMGKGPKIPALPQLARDMKSARAYAYDVRPKRASSREAWTCLKRFESSLFNIGVGAPKWRAVLRGASRIEQEAMHHAVALAKDATRNGRLWTRESETIVFEDQRVMTFTFKQRDLVKCMRPSWHSLRTKVQSIACRRAVLFQLSKLMVDDKGCLAKSGLRLI